MVPCPLQNFYTDAVVTLAGQPCTRLTLLDNATWTSLTCVAPSGQGTNVLILDVGSQAATVLFVYDAPEVYAVSPTPVDALVPVVITVG